MSVSGHTRWKHCPRIWQTLPAVLLLGVLQSFAQTAPDPWLILTNGERGSITSRTTRADLVRLYGAANVVDRDVNVGEGETELGTVIFPNDPKCTIDILWKTPEKLAPSSAQITGDASRWKASNGVSLGTTLKELEHLNGRPFHLAGFAWDYSGTVMSWDGGLLQAEFEQHGRVIIRLGGAQENSLPEAEQTQVMGDRDFSSQHPVMQKLNPRAYQIIWVFAAG